MGATRRQLLIGTAAGLATSGARAEALDVRTGDLIFHTSRSGQSAAIMWATKSLLSHCGMVRVYRGARYVIEARGPVQVTPFDTFVRRGRWGRYLVQRVPDLDDEARRRVWKAAKAYLGRPYDGLFLFGNRAIYCSELLWLAYRHIGLELGTIETAGALDVDNVIVDQVLQKRWRRHPSCRGLAHLEACKARLLAQPMITPEALADDERLATVFDNYPLGLR